MTCRKRVCREIASKILEMYVSDDREKEGGGGG
jgi:hypothetical protein